MASIGFAVGLGNIWRFPYVTGENGGSAFVVIYLACAFAIGVPILMAEVMLGRRGGLTPPGSVAAVAAANNRSRHWRWLGNLNLLTAFAILVTYCVVAGWVLYYLYQSTIGALSDFDSALSTGHFNQLLADVPTLSFWSFVTLVVAGGIIYGGVEKGIERAVTILMPTLFILMLGLVGFNLAVGGMPETIVYLLSPDFSKVGASTVLIAVGQAFFSIGVGMAGMMMFGAYLPKNISIGQSAIVIVVADTLVALVAGLVIFPMVFHNQLDPAGGAGLIFQTLPVAFAQMPGGHLVSILFFLLLSVAAITSVVGLCEPIGAWMAERFAWGRHKASMLVIVAAGSVGMISVLGYNHWGDVRLFGQSITTIMDFIPNQIFLPLGGLFIALFVGWFVKAEQARDELALVNEKVFAMWHNLVRYLVVPAMVVIFVAGMSE
jgi:neurotransmitter:Na+ symporter, NSS family